MPNETVGSVKCPIAGDVAEVRQDKKGKFYYVGQAGMIKPNLPAGQKWLKENAKLFKDQEREAINKKPAEFGRRFQADADFQAPPKTEEPKQESVSFWPFD